MAEEMATGARRYECDFETPFAPGSPWLNGSISVATSEVDVAPTDVTFWPETLYVDVYWKLGGSLAHLICGTWCVCVDFECFAQGPNYDVDKCYQLPFDCRNNGTYHHRFEIRVKDIEGDRKGDPCTVVCRIVATVSLLDSCGKPSRIAGFCQGPLVQFSTATH